MVDESEADSQSWSELIMVGYMVIVDDQALVLYRK
jgi:hypothetical protein